MPKPNEVLFRLHAIKAPDALGVEVNQRDDVFIKQQHEKLGVLPGQKVLATDLSVDRPWRLNNLFSDLRRGGYTLLNMNVEIRTDKVSKKSKPVMSLNFGLVGECTCTPEQLAWVQEYLGRAAFKLVQAYLNPRRDGSTQLAYDCINAVELDQAWHSPMPVEQLFALPAPEVTEQNPA